MTTLMEARSVKAMWKLSDRDLRTIGPDCTVPNPHHPSWPRMRLYDRDRVQAWIWDQDRDAR
jgi:hypothetical protein